MAQGGHINVLWQPYEFLVILGALAMGARAGGVGLGLWGAVGLLVLVVGFGILELPLVVEDGTLISGMFGQRSVSPRFSTLEVVVLSIEPHQVHREFTPGNDLVQEGFFVGFRRVCVLYSEHSRNRTDVAEVQVR